MSLSESVQNPGCREVSGTLRAPQGLVVRAHEADLRLVEQTLDGDQTAHAALLERIDRMFRMRFSRVAPRAPWLRGHEKDLLQRFRLRLLEDDWRYLRTYAGSGPLDGWLGVIAFRFVRRQAGALAPKGQVSVDEVPERADPTDSPEELAVRSAERRAVRDAVRRLPAKDQTLLGMMYEQEVGAEAVGKLLGLSPSGVRMRKKRLLERLGDSLRLALEGETHES